MLRIDILSLFPEIFNSILTESILKRAVNKSLAEYHIHNIRDYSTERYNSVDDYAYGGGAGMVLMPGPIANLILKLTEKREYDEIIFLCPDGEVLNQQMCNGLSMTKNLLLICGRYKGIDQRIRDKWVTKEISIGDYVLTGGELPAAILVDSIVRLLPGVLSDESSALSDSFQTNLLDAPAYTRPVEFMGMRVPDILIGGDHSKIEQWRLDQSYEKTRQRRPDLLED